VNHQRREKEEERRTRDGWAEVVGMLDGRLEGEEQRGARETT